MERLVKALGLPSADERDLLKELKDWEMKGILFILEVLYLHILAHLLKV